MPDLIVVPRFEVLGPYPDSIYSVGEIVSPDNGNTANGYPVANFPNLFRRLSWWEGIELSAMPDYLKDGSNAVHHVSSYNNTAIPNMPFALSTEGATIWLQYAFPATLSDYNAYITWRNGTDNFYNPGGEA